MATDGTPTAAMATAAMTAFRWCNVLRCLLTRPSSLGIGIASRSTPAFTAHDNSTCGTMRCALYATPTPATCTGAGAVDSGTPCGPVILGRRGNKGNERGVLGFLVGKRDSCQTSTGTLNPAQRIPDSP
ncbi:hypothetical protein SY2F82_33090 [Streptomyces sp. Y2F8-2]|nr:hypothetical protein SY2F82_33090 [Streptomyces sp. Y2F8-2]